MVVLIFSAVDIKFSHFNSQKYEEKILKSNYSGKLISFSQYDGNLFTINLVTISLGKYQMMCQVSK